MRSQSQNPRTRAKIYPTLTLVMEELLSMLEVPALVISKMGLLLVVIVPLIRSPEPISKAFYEEIIFFLIISNIILIFHILSTHL
jgi:hypothetical protein